MATRLQPGDRVGAYEIVETIGVDGASVHYLARALAGPAAGRSVTIKRFEEITNIDEPFITMFFDEAQLGTILQHPNIVQLFEIGRADGCYFMVFEYVDGECLYQHLRSLVDQRLSVPAALALGAGITAGLHYAHEKTTATGSPLGMLHGDLSPATVIVARDGEIKLIDLRVTRIPGPSGGRKMRYLSPEQCRGRPMDRRSDLFNLGIVLYEATTGRYPFAGDNDYAILQAIIGQEIKPPSRYVPGYPLALERIVMTALERDPERRYPTAKILGDALAAVAAGLMN